MQECEKATEKAGYDYEMTSDLPVQCIISLDTCGQARRGLVSLHVQGNQLGSWKKQQRCAKEALHLRVISAAFQQH